LGEPRVESAVQEADLVDPGIEESPDEAGGGHGAVRFAAVNDDEGVGGEAESPEGEDERGVRQEVAIGGAVVVGVVFGAIRAGLEVGGMNLDGTGDVPGGRGVGKGGVVDGGEVGLEEDARGIILAM